MWGGKTAKALCVFLAVSGGSTLSQTPCCGRLWLHPFAEYDEWLRGMEVALSLTAGNPWMRRSVSSASSQPVQQSPSKNKNPAPLGPSLRPSASQLLCRTTLPPACRASSSRLTGERVAEAAAAETSPSLPPPLSLLPSTSLALTGLLALPPLAPSPPSSSSPSLLSLRRLSLLPQAESPKDPLCRSFTVMAHTS